MNTDKGLNFAMESVRTANNSLTHIERSKLSKVLSPAIDCFLFPTTLTVPKLSKPLPSLCLSAAGSVSSPSSDHHTSLLVETFHEHRSFKALLNRLTRPGSCPLRLLEEDGDWTKEYFWAVVRFLRRASRCGEIVTLFDHWTSIEPSRIKESNYTNLITLLSEEGLIEEAITLFKDMKSHGLTLSREVYNSVIHGLARKGNFEEALFHLDEMRGFNVYPENDTYDGLIEAYASRKMYDEIGICLKRMSSSGCPPDRIMYNLLMREFSRGGLLKKMESTYHTMVSKGMQLEQPTLLAMIETYARFGILDKMEKFYTRSLKTKTLLPDDLIRKIAEVYIGNYMYSKLETLGTDLEKIFGGTDLLWCLRLLSHACILSRKGLDSVIAEMEEKQIPRNVTVSNIICLTHLKMRDFTRLRSSLSELADTVNPDMVSFGILFDAIDMGFNGKGNLETWRGKNFFDRDVEMNTEPLVLACFGKGAFLRNCEDAYSSLEREARESKDWTYENLIELVLRHKGIGNTRK